ncbi:MAG: transporter [Candidatus Acidiferrum sp.]
MAKPARGSLTLSKLAFAAALTFCSWGDAWAQDLAPRAYVITPVHSNAIILTYSYFSGNVLFDGAVPITGAVAHINVPSFTYYHSFNLGGRSANITATLPYGVGNFRGTVTGAAAHAYRSGMLDSFYRFSVNLKGGPALPLEDFHTWRQKMLIGTSLKIVAPTGQYDPTKLINWGTNRWAFKPEIGYSQRWGHWLLDAYAAAWFFTTNPEFFSHNPYFPGTQTQSESPVAAFEGHLGYDFKPRLWVSLDANFWHGGETSLNGVSNLHTVQRNSRIGATAAVPITKHQTLKISYNNGAYINYGGNYQNVSVAWQYSWIGWPK